MKMSYRPKYATPLQFAHDAFTEEDQIAVTEVRSDNRRDTIDVRIVARGPTVTELVDYCCREDITLPEVSEYLEKMTSRKVEKTMRHMRANVSMRYDLMKESKPGLIARIRSVVAQHI